MLNTHLTPSIFLFPPTLMTLRPPPEQTNTPTSAVPAHSHLLHNLYIWVSAGRKPPRAHAIPSERSQRPGIPSGDTRTAAAQLGMTRPVRSAVIFGKRG